jgi:hypothetical protein
VIRCYSQSSSACSGHFVDVDWALKLQRLQVFINPTRTLQITTYHAQLVLELSFCSPWRRYNCTETYRQYTFIVVVFSGTAAQCGLWPPRSRGFLNTQRRATVGWTPGRVISSSQRQHTQQTNIHAPDGIRAHDRSRRAAVDIYIYIYIYIYNVYVYVYLVGEVKTEYRRVELHLCPASQYAFLVCAGTTVPYLADLLTAWEPAVCSSGDLQITVNQLSSFNLPLFIRFFFGVVCLIPLLLRMTVPLLRKAGCLGTVKFRVQGSMGWPMRQVSPSHLS